MTEAGQRRGRAAAPVLMLASGFAGLGYQIVWTQQSSLWLGHEAAAVLAVVAAFFGGLACGALALGRLIATSGRPALWYALCELAIGAWAIVLSAAMSPVSSALLRLAGAQPGSVRHWAVAFVGTFMVLLPATAAMGATLPAMERVLARLKETGRTIAPLYAANTLGAVAGVLVCAFWLVPHIGLMRTAWVCATLNLLCALVSWLVFPRWAAQAPSSTPRSKRSFKALVALFATGALGIGYEVLVVRVLSEVAEDTVYTFALLLAIYLVGTAGGAAAYDRWLERRSAGRTRESLIVALSAACLLGTSSLWGAQHVRTLALAAFGHSMAAALAAEAALAAIAFGIPTVVMGAVFCHLCRSAAAQGLPFSVALGVNTLGAAAAPLFFGVLLLPLLGPALVLLIIAGGYLALLAKGSWRAPVTWIPAASAILLALFAPPLRFVDVPPGGHILSYRDGVMASVSVVEDAGGVAVLRIDNHQQEGSNATWRVDARQAWLPLLLHPAPARALFLGLGTGVTAAAAAADPSLDVDAAELLPEVIAASAYFAPTAADGPTRRPHLIAADARRFVRASNLQYDVIVADNFHPARSGSGSLYTVEHFRAVRSRLTADGLFCQWLPLHQLDLQTLRSIVQSFLRVFPGGWAMLASNSLETPVIGLVARADDARFDMQAMEARLHDPRMRTTFQEIGIEDALALLGSFVADRSSLARFAGSAPLNTDDRTIVAYRAPRATYAPEQAPRDRLLAFLHEVAAAPSQVLTEADTAWFSRLAAYAAARNLFIESGRAVRPSSDVRAMLAQVRAPLLHVLRVSPDFRPAYDPLLRMAGALAEFDAPAASALLRELMQVQPARAEAGDMLQRIDSSISR